MKTVGHWNAGLDDVVKIGWPWHGALQQVSPTMYTLTTPTGEVINLPAGDLSHAISYPVSLTGAASWRTGKCQRYQIPGLPPAVTTPAERADGMTWLNYFIESGIAEFGIGYYKLIDDSGKAWRFKIVYAGLVPSKLEMWHGANGTMAKHSEISIAPPSSPFVAPITILVKRGITVSSTGRLMAFNFFDIENPDPKWVFSMTITGSVLDNTLAAVLTKLLDSDIPGGVVTESGPAAGGFTGSYTTSRDFRLYKSTKVFGETGPHWGPWEDQGTTQGSSISGGWGPTTSSLVNGHGFPGPPPPSDTPPNTDMEQWAWGPVVGSGFYSASESSTGYFRSIKCLGYFVGHDDSLVRVESVYAREETGTSQIFEGSANETRAGKITYSDFVRVGGRDSARISDYDEYSGVNTVTFTRFAGPRGRVVNLLSEGHRAVAIATPVASGFSAYAYICGQVQDAAVYPTVFSSANAFPAPPNFSIHPVTGAILTRPNDGYPVSWV